MYARYFRLNAREVPMGAWVRRIHRWLSIAFTLAVIANIVVIARGGYIDWVGYLAVAPLMLLLASGLYLFILPYARARRRGAAGEA